MYRLHYRDAGGPWTVVGMQIVSVPAPAELVSLGAPHPNPFNPRVVVPFVLGRMRRVTLTIHDAAGREVVRLLDGEVPAGCGEAVWDGRDVRGRLLPSGVYLAHLRAGDRRQTRKLVLVR